MFGSAAADYVAEGNLGAVVVAEVAAAAGTAAAPSVDAVGGDREEAAAIAVRTAVEVEGKLEAAAAAEEVVETLGMGVVAVVAEEEEGQEGEAGNTARLELGCDSRN